MVLIVISGCGGPNRIVKKTPEGILKKIVVAQKEGVDVYDSRSFNKKISRSQQWDSFYLIEEFKAGFEVSPEYSDDYDQTKTQTYFIKKLGSEIIPWNTHYSLAFKDSPTTSASKRSRMYFFKTIDDLNNNTENWTMREKEKHAPSQPNEHGAIILKDFGNNILYVASLVDDELEDGRIEFLGHYNFGYVKPPIGSTYICRYVSRSELGDNLLQTLEAKQHLASSGNPDSWTVVAKAISDFISAGNKEVVNNIQKLKDIFSSPSDIPKLPERDLTPIFTKQRDLAKDRLIKVYDKINRHLSNDSNWDKSGHTCIPDEWINETNNQDGG